MHPKSPTLAVVGGGPRAISLLERILATLDGGEHIDIARIVVIEDTQFGAGMTWREAQSRELCMNTFAGAVTFFPDRSVVVAAPAVDGPTFLEWCLEWARVSRVETVLSPPITESSLFAALPLSPDLDDSGFRDEVASMRVQSHPTRVLFGRYLTWCFNALVTRLRSWLDVDLVLDRVVDISDRPGSAQQLLGMRNTDSVLADRVVITGGWVSVAPSPEDRALSHNLSRKSSLLWIPPAPPADQRIEQIRPGEDVLVRGLGMGFFDTMALLTLDRGGVFVEEEAAGLHYQPSGEEPVMHVTSGRGLPYRAKALYGGLPPASAQTHLKRALAEAPEGPLDFAPMWMAITKDALSAFYETLAGIDPDQRAPWWGAMKTAIDELLDPDDLPAFDREVERLLPGELPKLDHEMLTGSESRRWDSQAEYEAYVREYIDEDVREAARGKDSPLKAAYWSLGAARGPAAKAAEWSGLDGASWPSYRKLINLGAAAGSGPPAFRMRQLRALHEAGIVRFLGPRARVEVDDDAFVATSDASRATRRARVLLDAFVTPPDVLRPSDPLHRALASQGRMRAAVIPGVRGPSWETGSADISRADSRLIHHDGVVDPSVHLLGIPTEDTQGGTVISPVIGTNSHMIRETDRVVRSLVSAHAARTDVLAW
ncbi:FAD/NAD(P)-binding protein [Microbacterium sp. A84]|uniref:FAD/NAD(P)-binding protein n=1 Tax=Microbacterium sp. A84 TaxID=3450715 RepID=UPI003F4250D0